MQSSIETLTEINLDDLVRAVGWQRRPLLAAGLRLLFKNPARKFAAQMADFDNDVGRIGLVDASRTYLKEHLVHDVRVFGGEHVPSSGPLLILSNHPGMSDTVSLFASIKRPDLKIIASHVPFLASLANITGHLYFLNGDAAEAVRTVRQVSAHLRDGHAALTFPAGRIEPDVDVHTGAAASLNGWAASATALVRFAPETAIVPALVSGVIWEKAARHWLPRTRRTREEREQLAAALQLLVMLTRDARPTTVKVRFAKPIASAEFGVPDTNKVHQLVIARMRALIESPAEGAGVSLL
jgi:1-acyl-sn-glycerol-3-phosphate acyltransferase